MIQKLIYLSPKKRGFHLITEEIIQNLGPLPESGLLNLFLQHTSAGICINENTDFQVLSDFEIFFNRIAPENLAGIKHTQEGPDDMPAHIKSVLMGVSLNIPIIDHKLALGTWQGIYLGEFRNNASRRKILISVYS